MKAIAAELGVSRTAVSLVLKGEGDRYRIHPDTQKKIRDRIRKLNFKPDYFARALASRHTHTIGAVFPNVFEPFMNETIKGVEDVMYKHDYLMMLCTSAFDGAREARNIEQLIHRRVDGLLLMCTAPFAGETIDQGHVASLLAGPTPVVLVDRYLESMDSHYVVQDDAWAARKAVDKLAEIGCRRIAYVGFDLRITSLVHRRNGFLQGIAKAGLRESDSATIMLHRRDPASADLRDALTALFASSGKPDGIFVSTNGIAYKVRAVLAAMGIEINRDIAIAKFGADPDFSPSGMYCIKQPHAEMGRKAAQLLLDLMRMTGPSREYEHIVVRPGLSWE
jgi:DNA-binding LacI/PurR family transcriptional regulator